MSLGTQIKNKFSPVLKIFFIFLIIVFSNNLVFGKTVIGMLDKVSGKVSKITIEEDGEVFFGSLKIIVHTCTKSQPEEPPENRAFLEIWDIKNDKESKNVFSGWMFSSNPSISALEHAVYDVWVINCSVL